MPGLNHKQYERRLMATMAVYVGMMLLAWPMLRGATALPGKVVLALAPVLPMLYVIALMARRVRDSDELEQRTHLVALGVATAVVAALSLVGGFLASARVVALDGSILIWVFPLMMVSYGATRWWVARSYGMGICAEEAAGLPMHVRLLAMAGLLGLVVAVGWRSLDDRSAGVLSGMAVGFGLIGGVMGLVRWRARRHAASAAGSHDGGSR